MDSRQFDSIPTKDKWEEFATEIMEEEKKIKGEMEEMVKSLKKSQKYHKLKYSSLTSNFENQGWDIFKLNRCSEDKKCNHKNIVFPEISEKRTHGENPNKCLFPGTSNYQYWKCCKHICDRNCTFEEVFCIKIQ